MMDKHFVKLPSFRNGRINRELNYSSGVHNRMLSLNIPLSNRPELIEFYSFDWDWFVTGSSEEGTSLREIENKFSAWRKNLALATKLQIASMGVFTSHKGSHIHCMVKGFNRHNDSLRSINIDGVKSFEKDWKSRTHRTAQIKPVWSEGAKEYLVNHFFNNNTHQIACIHKIAKLRRRIDNGK